MKFTAENLKIDGVLELVRTKREDERGFFSRIYCEENLKPYWNIPIKQINHSFNASKGTVRGMHYQASPFGDSKIVGCIKGKVWDVVVDLRQGSKTYLNHVAVVLSSENLKSLLIPEGCAHGFQTLEDNTELIYIHSTAYYPEHDVGVSPMDKTLSINWPLKISEISEKDLGYKPVSRS
jgi:dTDP-4-dehydrorhamnose 3,5-epimerase